MTAQTLTVLARMAERVQSLKPEGSTSIPDMLRRVARDSERFPDNETAKRRRRLLLRGYRSALDALATPGQEEPLAALEQALREELFSEEVVK